MGNFKRTAGCEKMEEPAYIEKLIYGTRRLAFFFEFYKRKKSLEKKKQL